MMTRVRVWDVPTAVWAYGVLRAAAFLIPFATGTGGFGLGLVVVLVLWVLLVRGSRVAWVSLVLLDLLSLGLLLVSWRVAPGPLLLPITAGLALAVLLLPTVRRSTGRRDLETPGADPGGRRTTL